ncbi:MAG TPA: DNA polymerase/3'-5' exonuclease PolX [Burkholderiales bacterium]|nr:DNA polymerase/3'-5' exonuclease PolX [Burkholderiales bacterium]
MPVHNADIAAALDQIADLLELKNDNPFRIRAYRNAARIVGAFGQDIKSVFDRGGELPKLPGIGPDLAGKIHEITASGSCRLLDELQQQFPPAVTELLKLPGLGPKRVKTLYDRLKLQTFEELRAAANAEKIRELPGFGARTEEHILQALAARTAGSRRFRLATAVQYADALLAYLRKCRGVEQVTVAGSYRRRRDTVGDLDIVITAAPGSAVMNRFCDYDEVREVLARGETRASVVLKAGLQVDLRLVPRVSYGAALHYFTGSKAHNIAIRRLGQGRGLKINEYGVFRGERRIAGETEQSVYDAVGLPYIEPELREDRGEIEAARRGELPQLVTLPELKGDLHTHTKASDGHHTIEEMALAARRAGLQYMAITEHSRRLAFARGLDPQRLAKQADEIDRVNEKLDGITVLKGIEVDILEDGSLDLPDSVLKRLDIVVGAVHSAFDLPRRAQTDRLLRAMDNRHLRLLAHPCGRLIGEREPYDVDMLAVIRKEKKTGCVLELNAQPERLDLDEVHCQMARDEGVLLAVDSDAHYTHEFSNLRYGIGQARRGWLEAKDVLNTRALAELKRMLR